MARNAIALHAVQSSMPEQPPGDMIKNAVGIANRGPCAKSKRGAVIWSRSRTGERYLALGHNAPPPGFVCTGAAACRANCAKTCEHAEAAALRKVGMLYRGCEMAHVKVVDGVLVPSGPPSCWQCSRSILAHRIAGMWLFHEDGWRRYTALEFHRTTLETCGIAVAEG